MNFEQACDELMTSLFGGREPSAGAIQAINDTIGETNATPLMAAHTRHRARATSGATA